MCVCVLLPIHPLFFVLFVCFTRTDCLMSLCLVMMVKYDQLDSDAAFAAAFKTAGLPWAQYLVALGAVLG